MSKYLKQLSADLPRWVGMGYVNEGNSALILKDAEANQKEGWFRLPLILSMLGGLLVFAGVISWVAGNWDDIPRLTRVLMLVAAMLGSFITAHYLRERGSEGMAQGFAFLGALMFGADIMLIAQIYQLPANPPAGALMWALGAAAVAIVWPSQLSMALAFLLAGIWTVFAGSIAGRNGIWDLLFTEHRQIHFVFLLLWGVLAAYSVKREWNKALHLAGISLCIWCCYSFFALYGSIAPQTAGMMMATLLLILTLAGQQLALVRPGAGIVSKYLWVNYMIWILFMTAPDIYRQSLFDLRHSHLSLPVLGLIVALSAAGVITNRLRPVAAAMLMGALLVLIPQALLAFISPVDTVYSGYGPVSVMFFMSQILVAALPLALAVGSIVHGYKTGEKFFINLGFVLFALKLIWIYFDNEWSLAGRAPFFIVGGLLIVALGLVFDRQRRKLIATMKEGQ